MKLNCSTEDESKLRSAETAIQAAVDRGKEALLVWERAGAELTGRELRLVAAIGALNPTDEPSVASLAVEQSKLNLLRRWVVEGQSLWQVAGAIRAALSAAVDPIRAAAQPRSIEEAALSACSWEAGLRPREVYGISGATEYCRVMTEAARRVLADIGVVLATRRGGILSEDERRTGFLRDGPVTVRRLDFAERAAGYAQT